MLLTEMLRVLSKFVRMPANVTPATPLTDAFEVDSLTMIDLVVALEDHTGLRIPDEDAELFRSVGDVLHFIETAARSGHAIPHV